jgi:hypothetical protein
MLQQESNVHYQDFGLRKPEVTFLPWPAFVAWSVSISRRSSAMKCSQ